MTPPTVDDAHGVITALETTAGDVDEGTRLASLCAQHEAQAAEKVATVVADSKYGTIRNYVSCQQAGVTTHMADFAGKQRGSGRQAGIFGEEKFLYQPESDTFRCPAGQTMKARRLHPTRQTWEYVSASGVCARCPLRSQCTRSQSGRTIHRHRDHEWLQRARTQAASFAARRDRRRRKHLMEGSFADGANNHGLKRARWRRLWRQTIQDHLIAACQNIRILLSRGGSKRKGSAQALTALLLREAFPALHRQNAPPESLPSIDFLLQGNDSVLIST